MIRELSNEHGRLRYRVMRDHIEVIQQVGDTNYWDGVVDRLIEKHHTGIPTTPSLFTDTGKSIAIDDKDGRLAARSTIESFQLAMQEVVGSERGEAEELNDKGLTEYFVEGAYIRSLLIPAGMTIVSRLWNRERLWIIVSGDVTFTTELGRRRVKAPLVEMAPFGTKVALHAHEDTLWIAVTGADSDNNEDVENEVMTNDYNELSYPWDMIEHTGEEL